MNKAADAFFTGAMGAGGAAAPAPASAGAGAGAGAGSGGKRSSSVGKRTGGGAGAPLSESAKAALVEAEFASLKDPDVPADQEQKLNLAQIVPWIEGLGLDPYSDPVVTLLFYYMGCEVQGIITWPEFKQGFGRLG